jgi:predicted DNA-binding transcriptional regulator AlpA
MDKALNETETAKMMGFAVQTLRNWRSQRKGPPYIKLKYSVRYNQKEVMEYMKRHTIHPEDLGRIP